MDTACLTVHQLRRRWKPIKERLQAAQKDHPTTIRLHRALSWLERCEADAEQPDLHLICLWVGFNALYGQWDPQRREPRPDRECWPAFIKRVLQLDATGHLSSTLIEQREGVMTILDDAYLSRWFWEEPSDIRAAKSRKVKYDARTWYIEQKWELILDRLLERIYLLRCQLVHGAATYNSRLNRASLHPCVAILRHLLNAIALALIDHGADEDWGPMCYPPLDGGDAVYGDGVGHLSG